jgi:hypothetical protein
MLAGTKRRSITWLRAQSKWSALHYCPSDRAKPLAVAARFDRSRRIRACLLDLAAFPFTQGDIGVLVSMGMGLLTYLALAQVTLDDSRAPTPPLTSHSEQRWLS